MWMTVLSAYMSVGHLHAMLTEGRRRQQIPWAGVKVVMNLLGNTAFFGRTASALTTEQSLQLPDITFSETSLIK